MSFYNAAVTKDEYLQREREYIYNICTRDVTYLRFFSCVIYIIAFDGNKGENIKLFTRLTAVPLSLFITIDNII